MSKSIKISEDAEKIIDKVSKITGIAKTKVLDMAVEEFVKSKKYAQCMLFEKK